MRSPRAVEHAQAEQLLEQLRGIFRTPSKQFGEALQKLEDAVQHHVQEEENDVLPGMREQLDNKRRQQLGEAFAARRATELMPKGGRGGDAGGKSKGELYEEAKQAGVSGRSSMNKEQLAERLEEK